MIALVAQSSINILYLLFSSHFRKVDKSIIHKQIYHFLLPYTGLSLYTCTLAIGTPRVDIPADNGCIMRHSAHIQYAPPPTTKKNHKLKGYQNFTGGPYNRLSPRGFFLP